MKQIAVGGVKLDHVEADTQRSLGGLDELGLDPRHPVRVQRFRPLPAVVMGDRRWSDDRPCLIRWQRAASFPRPVVGTFSSGMGQLHPDRAITVGSHRVDHAS